MNLGEIIESIKEVAAKASTGDLDEGIKRAVNRAYRRLCRGRTWGALIVRAEEFTTVASTMSYVLPYPLERIINDSLRYDVTTSLPGTIITLRNAGSVDVTIARALSPSGIMPIVASIGNGAVSEFSHEGNTAEGDLSASLGNGDDNYGSGNSPGPSSAWEGRYIRFGVDSRNKNGGDYGYKIDDVTGSTITLDRPYRGPSLVGMKASITPANSLWLTFSPTFTDSAKTVTYDWYSKPMRLYNDYDVPEIPELSDAIVARVLADNPIYHRPQSYDRLNYEAMAREELLLAIKTGLQ